ncbi:putative glycosyltransferase [Symbiodinium microadriaticum]|uniref:Putative glycosyltransferase n=1 Tax=Symbiodinium microadriaticum TaxID=2951 RepID=A0A1Q9CIZ4_SYMMI|nr:putative glycosyltransferase [Symbiodinium microadriaticum]
MESARLTQLRERAAALRDELKAVEAKIDEAVSEGALPEEGVERHLHHRPSWSMLGGSEGASSKVLRQLGPADQNFQAVLGDFPKLDVSPIGSFNHWDRRECAVQNADEWRQCCREYMESLGGTAAIPRVIHQIWVGPKEPPCLWLDTFRADFIEAHPDWRYELWSDERVAQLPMFNEKIYMEEKMWQCKADILRLEFLWHHGGVYVDADMISVGKKSLNPIIELGKETGWVIAYEPDTKDKPYSILGNSVIACTPHHPLTLMLILFLKQTFYQKRNHIEVFAVTGPVMYTKCLVDSDMPISIAAQELLYPAFHFVPNPDAIDFNRFPRCLMFQFGYTCSGLEGYVKRRNRCKRPSDCPFHAKTPHMGAFRALPQASDAQLYGQVPIALAHMEDLLSMSNPADGSYPLEEGTAFFLFDGELVQLVDLRQRLPGFIDRLSHQPWDILMLGMEWSTGADEIVLFNVPPGGRPRNSNCLAVLVNVAGTRNMQALRPALQRCVTETGFDPSPLFGAANQLKLWFAAQKYPGTLEEARIWKSVPQVRNVFQQLAKHEPPIHCQTYEVHGNLLKGMQDGRMVFEMVLEPNGGIQFRAWNDDSSPNCEMKTGPGKVEWMKVFYNHQICFEAQNKPL